MTRSFQLAGRGPRAYEDHLVPVFFAPCAEQLLDLARVGPGERVLDVACGSGIVARRAAVRVGGSGTVTGVDLNPGMIELARSAAPGIDWHTADVTALPVEDGGFDVVCCQQGLQFFPEPAGALAELRRVLAPGGRLVVAVWRSLSNQPAFGVFVEALRDRLGEDVAAMMRSPFAGPGREELRTLLTGAGFADPLLRIGILPVRFASVAEFVGVEVAATPMAEPVGALPETERAALLERVERDFEPFRDDAGVAFPMQTWLVLCGRGS